MKTFAPPNSRESEVLGRLLGGRENREIVQVLPVRKSTVKPRVRSIFSQYDLCGRSELISTLLKNQSGEKSRQPEIFCSPSLTESFFVNSSFWVMRIFFAFFYAGTGKKRERQRMR